MLCKVESELCLNPVWMQPYSVQICDTTIRWDVVKQSFEKNFIVTPCINNIQHFNNQLTQTTLKNAELLKHFKISKTAPTCFGLQGNHHQGPTIST